MHENLYLHAHHLQTCKSVCLPREISSKCTDWCQQHQSVHVNWWFLGFFLSSLKLLISCEDGNACGTKLCEPTTKRMLKCPLYSCLSLFRKMPVPRMTLIFATSHLRHIHRMLQLQIFDIIMRKKICLQSPGETKQV